MSTQYEKDLEAVKFDGKNIRYVKRQTPGLCMEAVKQDGWALEYVQEQTYEICRAAINNHGRSIMFVKQQTHELCSEAVKNDAYALAFVTNQTHDICLIAINNHPWALECVRDLSSINYNVKQFDDKKCTNVYYTKRNSKTLFTIDYHYEITKEEFIEKLNDNSEYMLEQKPHREEYLKFLEQF